MGTVRLELDLHCYLEQCGDKDKLRYSVQQGAEDGVGKRMRGVRPVVGQVQDTDAKSVDSIDTEGCEEEVGDWIERQSCGARRSDRESGLQTGYSGYLESETVAQLIVGMNGWETRTCRRCEMKLRLLSTR